MYTSETITAGDIVRWQASTGLTLDIKVIDSTKGDTFHGEVVGIVNQPHFHHYEKGYKSYGFNYNCITEVISENEIEDPMYQEGDIVLWRVKDIYEAVLEITDLEGKDGDPETFKAKNLKTLKGENYNSVISDDKYDHDCIVCLTDRPEPEPVQFGIGDIVRWENTFGTTAVDVEITSMEGVHGCVSGRIYEVIKDDRDYIKQYKNDGWNTNCIKHVVMTSDLREAIERENEYNSCIAEESTIVSFIEKLVLAVLMIILFIGALLFIGGKAKAQTQKGSFIIETGVSTADARTSASSVMVYNSKDSKGSAVALNVGYFVTDGLAIKAGYGFATYTKTIQVPPSSGIDHLTYKRQVHGLNVGVEAYINNRIPVEFNYSAGIADKNNKDAHFLTAKLGYAVYIGNRVTLKPHAFWSHSLNDNFKSELGIGATIALKLN